MSTISQLISVYKKCSKNFSDSQNKVSFLRILILYPLGQNDIIKYFIAKQNLHFSLYNTNLSYKKQYIHKIQ